MTRYSVETKFKGLDVQGIVEILKYDSDHGMPECEVNVEIVYVFDGDKFLDLYNLPSALSFEIEHALLQQLEKDHDQKFDFA